MSYFLQKKIVVLQRYDSKVHWPGRYWSDMEADAVVAAFKQAFTDHEVLTIHCVS